MYKRISTLTLFVLLALIVRPIQAQGNDIWDGVINPDGTINYGNLTDQGVVTQNVDWMPSIPLIGDLQAEYHIYTTPNGNTIVLPSATTMFFMMLNPSESGLNASDANYGNALAGLAALLTGAGVFPQNSVEASQFADALIAGQTDIWSLGFGDVTNLLSFLLDASRQDLNLYTLALLYTPGSCFASPGGCPPEILDLLDDIDFDPPPLPPSTCQEPVVIPGQISRNAVKTAPNYPLVVGQDPNKTGVTVLFSASVAPTIYRYWTLEAERECAPGPSSSGGYNCGGGTGHTVVTGWYCERHEISYPECIASAAGALRLTQASRDWIVTELAIRYPGAYVHRPSFAFSGPIACSWSYTAERVQIQDPGQWQAFVNGQTSGTPVSPARSFGGPAGSFQVWLKETAIIE